MPKATPLYFLLAALVLFVLHLRVPATRKWVWKVMAVMGFLLISSGTYLGLAWAPSEREMGEVGRILYVHVPQVWVALVGLAITSVGSVIYLFKPSWVTDSLNEAAAEVGVFFGTIGVLLGAIWGKPTWGVWWTWDPRLTTAATMLIIGAGYLALRKFVDDPERRATWSSVVGILAGVDLILVWYSVKWWRTLHQVQSTPMTVNSDMATVLRWNGVAFMCLLFVFIWQRYLLAKSARAREVALPSALPEAPGNRPSHPTEAV